VPLGERREVVLGVGPERLDGVPVHRRLDCGHVDRL